ncbi:MoaD/ThiS family protein [Rubrivirga sp. IMCC45206]|uniref:MoaD/ThiS family protein n=1 Tax=Rubrivirga sp. IMCC45206 TaxID=3391614 RepID=UPI00398FFA16
MTVRVLLFDVLRREIGAAEVSADLPDGASGDALLDRLADIHAPIARHRPTIRLAVDHRYVPLATPIAPGAEVALITPVSGG